jgi:hypothetical protein
MINNRMSTVVCEMHHNALYATYDVVSTCVLGRLEDNSCLKAGYKLDKSEHM